ncbi:putative multicopper oxidase [Cryomyces antarcticus]
MLSRSLTSFLAVALPLCSGVAAVPSGTVKPRADALAACAASMNSVLPSPTPPGYGFSGNVRQYYVAAEEIEWNYAPTGWDNWLGVPLNLSPRAQVAGATAYGTTWLKALYRGYTDATFSTKSPQPPWQGTLGPTLRSEVGDMVEIMFVNKLSKNYASMHSMGLAYTKYNEGSDYPNNTAPGQQVNLPPAEAVPPGIAPGDCVVYKWFVDDNAGPPAGQHAAVHSYHSYLALQQDANAGLIGAQIVYAPGQMAPTMANYREFPLLYMIYNEMDSFLSGQNAAALQSKNPSYSGPWYGSGSGSGSGAAPSGSGPGAPSSGTPSSGAPSGGAKPNTNNAHSRRSPQSAAGAQSYGAGEDGSYGAINTDALYSGNYSVWHPQLVNLAGANQFMGAPSFYSMNGYIFANNPTYEMCLNDKVIWYTMAYGSMSHVFHMHGNGFYYNGVGMPSISINDGEMKTLYMNATGAGRWQVMCHVHMHQTMGMVSNYQVHFAGQCPLPALGSQATIR